MATVEAPSPGLFAAVLHSLRGVEPRTHTVGMTLGDLIGSVSDRQADQLPAAIGEILPLLRSDPDRLRFAVDALVQIDLFEAADAVTAVAWQTGDCDLLLADDRG